LTDSKIEMAERSKVGNFKIYFCYNQSARLLFSTSSRASIIQFKK
jgi:hypothetical protein